MDRLKGLVSLLVVAGIVLAILRVIHLGLPLVYPQVLRGPFSLDAVADVEEYSGFSPLVPFYRPQVLGQKPINITVKRGLEPEVTIFWQGDHFLYLHERRGGPRPPVPETARPVEGAPDHETVSWRQGRTTYAQTRRGEIWVELRTDLGENDVRRILDTLRAYEELL